MLLIFTVLYRETDSILCKAKMAVFCGEMCVLLIFIDYGAYLDYFECGLDPNYSIVVHESNRFILMFLKV